MLKLKKKSTKKKWKGKHHLNHPTSMTLCAMLIFRGWNSTSATRTLGPCQPEIMGNPLISWRPWKSQFGWYTKSLPFCKRTFGSKSRSYMFYVFFWFAMIRRTAKVYDFMNFQQTFTSIYGSTMTLSYKFYANDLGGLPKSEKLIQMAYIYLPIHEWLIFLIGKLLGTQTILIGSIGLV